MDEESREHLSISQGGGTQHVRPVRLRKPVSTDAVECDIKWNSSESATVVSATGVRVSVELRGETVPGKTEADNKCSTTWTVHVTANDQPQTIVVDGTWEDDWHYENYFEIGGWSRDGKFLLMTMITVGGDWDVTVPVVYDLQHNQMWRTELAPIFGALAPKDCDLYFRPLGFTASDKVLVDVASLDADDLPPGKKPCFQQSRWALDFVQKQVSRVSAQAITETFGTVLAKK